VADSSARAAERLDRAERVARVGGALVAGGALALTAPGVVSSMHPGTAFTGRPELVFSPIRFGAIAVGWFGLAAAAWQPLPGSPGPRLRTSLLVGGTAAYATGMSLAVAGRLALGSAYRPSSTLGFALAPHHRLVTTGPFGLVRHPMYAGLALAAIGALCLYRTWTSVWLVAQVPVLVARARREEALLARVHGAQWHRYAASVPAWLPAARRLAATQTPWRRRASVGGAAAVT
jgi:protein-S-isoprenylcysteine O-methyltransferase Ste14